MRKTMAERRAELLLMEEEQELDAARGWVQLAQRHSDNPRLSRAILSSVRRVTHPEQFRAGQNREVWSQSGPITLTRR